MWRTGFALLVITTTAVGLLARWTIRIAADTPGMTHRLATRSSPGSSHRGVDRLAAYCAAHRTPPTLRV